MMTESQVCLTECRRAGRRGGLTVRGPRRGAVVPLHPSDGQILADGGGVMRWRNLHGRSATIEISLKSFSLQSLSNTSALSTPSLRDAEWGFSPLGRFGLLAFLAFETDLFGWSHNLQLAAECGR
jgi:hypothetical protein